MGWPTETTRSRRIPSVRYPHQRLPKPSNHDEGHRYQKEAGSQQSLISGHESLQHRRDAEAENTETQVPMWLESLELFVVGVNR